MAVMEYDEGLRGFDSARKSGFSNTTEYGTGEFLLPTRPSTGTGAQSSSKASSIIRSQQTEEAYPDIGKLSTELDKAQKERDQAALDRNQAAFERDKAALDRDQAALERDKTVLMRDSGLLKVELEQTQMVQETTANGDQLKSELERLQRR